MQLKNFEITSDNITQYLDKHKDDASIKYREAMFVKYMRECSAITQEAMEIIIQKYNQVILNVDGISCIWNSDVLTYQLPSFTDYLNSISNLDISGMCHILIPTMKYYGQEDTKNISGYSLMLQDVLDLSLSEKSLLDELVLAVDDYEIANQTTRVIQDDTPDIIKIKLSRKDSIRQLLAYENIYGEEAVKKITQFVKERV